VHELSIAMNILDIVGTTCHEQGYSRVETIRVNVGKASGIMTDSLVFAFEYARNDTVAANATIEINEIPLGGHCSQCDSDFTANERFVLNCPLCGGTSFKITAGHELEIVELEVDE
jgi:hydrogenase nickel incorporation protein HypA/HybF